MEQNQTILEQITQLLIKIGFYIGLPIGSISGMLAYERMKYGKPITLVYGLCFYVLGLSMAGICYFICSEIKANEKQTIIACCVTAMFSKDIMSYIKSKGIRRVVSVIASRDWKQIIILLSEDRKNKNK